MGRFNAQDHERLAASLNYPHIRLARTFARFESAEEFAELSRRGKAYLQREGWHHTEVASIEAVQVSDDKVHLVMLNHRCRESGEVYQEASPGHIITTHHCDVADEDAVNAFRDAVQSAHDTDHIDLLFNNAGIGGGGSFVRDTRDEWERTFNICWFGVYNCARAFMPMLLASTDAHMINTSSVNGFWATLGPQSAHSAYSAAKFAVKGFSEALVTDFANNAPHVKVSVVMPGHIGTSIAINSGRIMRGGDATPEELSHMRERFTALGMLDASATDDQLREIVDQIGRGFRDNAPTTAEQAASIILDGVREERWRILVGDDAHVLDQLVRENPEEAYSEGFLDRLRDRVEWNLS